MPITLNPSRQKSRKELREKAKQLVKEYDEGEDLDVVDYLTDAMNLLRTLVNESYI